ncbi:uncharacterized protein EV422DRAFT_612156 [Fimicolochytrium jonesii]|uniref:uncharacterized protein n=1 Tax=Fimicolochytrium jonesii TaxID=1396493 RepID=UPI0022FF0CBE|nr:uncharacterized protein EV422DRAFT_612156 [Fimicolochytrium jonesii]KAI8823680.1 hypothetical protein EV422DRAFT_612156 [Fimicolochytrium jonesii]
MSGLLFARQSNLTDTTNLLSNDTSIDDDVPLVQDARWYNFILWAPFVGIPATIITVRIIRYLWRIYQARIYGYDEDLFSDPLAELGLSINRGFRNTKDIRKIRKEARKAERKLEKAGGRDTVPGYDGATLPSPTRRFITGFAPFDAAEDYFHILRRRTRKTWSERLSPEAMRRWIETSRYARIWMVFQVACTLFAIVNYVLLTYSIGRQDKRLIKYLDLWLATMFLMDYALSFYTSEDRLRFYFNIASLVDLFSIVPPFVYVLISETSQYVWFLGLLRILRASRILRTYRLLSFSETEEKRELTILGLSFLNFVFLSASIINALESIHASSVDNASLENWHDSLYYIMVTFSTIGFGDLTPSSIPSRIVVICLIIIVITFVPIQTGKIAEIYNSTSSYQRANYKSQQEHCHVILGGTVSYTAVIDFCREYFVADPDGHVVILNDEEPNLDVRRLLRHPFYRNRVVYLRGTALSATDLQRCHAHSATALFLLNLDCPPTEEGGGGEDEQLRVTRGVDAQILMQALVAKNAFPGLPIFGEVQDIRSQDLSQTCGCDRVLCIDEIKMSILARNCLVPGILTLIFNLVHTYKDTHANVNLPIDPGFGHDWTTEYQHGAGHQIYAFKVPSGLVGVRFHHVVREVWMSFGAIVFAVMSANAGFNSEPIRLNPGRDYRFRHDDIAFCAAEGGDELMLRIMLEYKDTAMRDELNLAELGKEMDVVVGTPILKTAPLARIQESYTPTRSTQNVSEGVAAGPSFGSSSPVCEVLPNSIGNHIILCGAMTSRAIRHFVRSIRGSNVTAVPNSRSPTSLTPIVCLLESVPNLTSADSIWSDILGHPGVWIIRGTPLKRTSLLQAGVERCSKMVVFTKNQKATNAGADLPDANSVFIVKMLQKEWPETPFIVELSNGSNVKFFSSKDTDWNADNLRMQSILNNYALSIADRLALYKKVRAQGASKEGTFLWRLWAFVMGKNDDEASATAKATKAVAQRRKSKFPVDTRASRARSASGAHSEGATGATPASPSHRTAPSTYHSIPARLASDSVHPEDVNLDSDSENGDDMEGVSGANAPDTTVPLTTAYLQRLVDEAELNATGVSPFPAYHFDRHFAAGMITTSSFMHSLLSQSYFRPYVVDVVRALSTHVTHLRVPPECIGKKYAELVLWCIEKGIVPLGLLRRPPASATKDKEHLPYVFTNCRGFDIVRKEDLIFCLEEMTS